MAWSAGTTPLPRTSALGICVVSPDRPGIGRTDRLPGHGMLPWVRVDVVALLAHLGLDRFAVLGWSEGGQYALAVAYELGEQVSRCAVVAGCPPLDDASTFRELNRLDRRLSSLSTRAPGLARGYFRLTGLLAGAAPRQVIRLATRELPADEAEAVRAQGRWLPTILGEGARQPQGCVDEYRAMSAPWGFAPEYVGVPVAVFQGGADVLFPPLWGQVLAERIPRGTLRSVPEGGHFIALTRSAEILGYLAGGAAPVAEPPAG